MIDYQDVAPDQYLTFSLAGETFALPIASVKEILDMPVLTPVPRTPDFMPGVLNLRGTPCAVTDLRLKFGLNAEDGDERVVIIVEYPEGDDIVYIGALVDGVHEVAEMKQDQIDPPPKMGSAVNESYIRGMGKRDETFVIILDISAVFGDAVEHAQTAVPPGEVAAAAAPA